MVYVLPEPVTPSSVWYDRPSSMFSTSLRMASGWSPAGGYGWYSWNGEPSNVTNFDSSYGLGTWLRSVMAAEWDGSANSQQSDAHARNRSGRRGQLQPIT